MLKICQNITIRIVMVWGARGGGKVHVTATRLAQKWLMAQESRERSVGIQPQTFRNGHLSQCKNNDGESEGGQSAA